MLNGFLDKFLENTIKISFLVLNSGHISKKWVKPGPVSEVWRERDITDDFRLNQPFP